MLSSIAHGLRTLTEALVWPIDYMPEWAGLTLISIVSGAVMLWVFGKTTPQRHLERARDRMLAAVYEIRLYIDSPGRVFMAQGRLFVWSLAYTALMIPAFIVLTPPLGLLYLHLDTRYGLDPLPAQEALVVQVALDDDVDGQAVEISESSDNVAITAPPLFIEDEGLVYFRVVMAEEENGFIDIKVGDEVVKKALHASPDNILYSPQRGGGWAAFWVETGESSIDADGVQYVSVNHPSRDFNLFGLPMPWWVYWLIVATIAALALRKRMGVVL